MTCGENRTEKQGNQQERWHFWVVAMQPPRLSSKTEERGQSESFCQIRARISFDRRQIMCLILPPKALGEREEDCEIVGRSIARTLGTGGGETELGSP